MSAFKVLHFKSTLSPTAYVTFGVAINTLFSVFVSPVEGCAVASIGSFESIGSVSKHKL